MPRHRYISKNVLFDDEEEWSRKTTKYDVYGRTRQMEAERKAALDRQEEVLRNTLAASNRALGMLQDTEDIGITAGQELDRQREALKNTNNNLDKINADLMVSQRRINGMKSIFKSFRNYVTGKPRKVRVTDGDVLKQSHSQQTSKRSSLDPYPTSTLNKSKDHPSTPLQGLGDSSQKVEELIDANLNEMVNTVTRLKDIGLSLGQEIDEQNRLIDDIQAKVENSDVKIGSQNKQMEKLLGKEI